VRVNLIICDNENTCDCDNMKLYHPRLPTRQPQKLVSW